MVSSLATPLWRQGPVSKPVLCNACGSRYRLRGNLDNYFSKYCVSKEVNHKNNDFTETSSINVSNLDSDDDKNDLYLNESIILLEKRNLKFVYKRKTPMEKFHEQLFNELKNVDIPDESCPEEVLLFENVNNFIPSNEIGLGAILLDPDSIPKK